MCKLLTILLIFISTSLISQKIISDTNLTIKHGDMTLYLTNDTCTMVSKHVLSYSNFLKLDKERDDKWFEDKFKGKYNKNSYYKSGYDIGHLTPSHITSYDNTLNHNSFSLFNASPQTPSFNRGSWKKLELSIEDTISKYKKGVIIITGVIYDIKDKKYLGSSKIPIPSHYFKILYLDKKIYAWLGSNINGDIKETTIKELNKLFKINKQKLKIN